MRQQAMENLLKLMVKQWEAISYGDGCAEMSLVEMSQMDQLCAKARIVCDRSNGDRDASVIRELVNMRVEFDET